MVVADGHATAPQDIGNEIQSELRSLSSAAKSGIGSREFVAEYIRVVMRFLPVRSMRVWLGDDIDQLLEIGHGDRGAEGSTAQFAEFPNRDVMAAALGSRSAKICSASTTDSANAGHQADSASWIFVPITGASAVHGLSFCELVPSASATATVCVNRLQAITEVVLPYFEAKFTRDLLREKSIERRFQEFNRSLHFEPSLSTTPSTVATEYLRFFEPDRTWVILRSSYRWKVKAVGGIPGFQRRADVVRKLERLVGLIARSNEPYVWSAGEVVQTVSPRFRKALDTYLDEAHVSKLRVEPLIPSRQSEDTLPGNRRESAIGFVVCEWFQPVAEEIDEGHWQIAREQCALAIRNATDWSEAPVALAMRRWRRGHSWKRATGWGMILAGLAVAAFFAAAIPLEYTIDATGEMLPVQRRHVFATSPGIIRVLNVNSGATVTQGQTLLEMDSPELELEIRRTEGELQTTDKRISAIEASRLDFGVTSSDSVSQINSLAGELKELRQKRENFGRELETLNQRRDELKVLSPIQGHVVTWDLERTLARRPVTRGQRLLTVSDNDGPWELQLRVRDDDTSDLFAAMKKNRNVPIEFVIVTLPEAVHATVLKSTSETVEIRIPGEDPTLLCRAEVPEALKQSAVEGMSVRSRIHCGRRPAIVVAFTKLWRTIREQILFPWGW